MIALLICLVVAEAAVQPGPLPLLPVDDHPDAPKTSLPGMGGGVGLTALGVQERGRSEYDAVNAPFNPTQFGLAGLSFALHGTGGSRWQVGGSLLSGSSNFSSAFAGVRFGSWERNSQPQFGAFGGVMRVSPMSGADPVLVPLGMLAGSFQLGPGQADFRLGIPLLPTVDAPSLTTRAVAVLMTTRVAYNLLSNETTAGLSWGATVRFDGLNFRGDLLLNKSLTSGQDLLLRVSYGALPPNWLDVAAHQRLALSGELQW